VVLAGKPKGQVFVISAVLFSSLVVLLFLTTADTSQIQQQNTVRDFYDNVFNGAPEKMNSGLEKNYSIRSARNSIYSYSRFIDRSSASKGIKFEASYLVVMPQKGRSLFINYQDSSEKLRLYNSKTGWKNNTVTSKQYIENSFSEGSTDFRVLIPGKNVDRNFTATSPRLFSSMKVSAQNQIWINSELS